MDKTEIVKERIINSATELIEQNNGEVKNITARMIAQRAGVGLGLINYHFKSKDNLITVCVQRIIGNVVKGFHDEREYATDNERLTAWAVHVFDFLYDHPAVSRISILGDFHDYSPSCNSVLTQRGFMHALSENNENNSTLIFMLTSVMQAAFLGSDTVGRMLGFDLENPEQRALFIKKLVDILMKD